jgi:hypothetical protein
MEIETGLENRKIGSRDLAPGTIKKEEAGDFSPLFLFYRKGMIQ